MTQLNENGAGIVDVVRRDHREIEQMFADVEGASGNGRARAFDALAQKLKAHEAAEQEVVHPITEEVGATDVADSVEKEESTASRLLSSLEQMGTESAEFDAKFQELKSDVMAHAQHEESEEHPRIIESESAEHMRELGEEFESAEQRAAQQ
jgi:hemerythrin superfamily protein